MDLKQVIFFAQKNGYETVEKLNNWNGYECYEPIMDFQKETEIGPPLLILVKGDKIRMSTPEEAFQQMDKCQLGEDGYKLACTQNALPENFEQLPDFVKCKQVIKHLIMPYS